MIFLKIFYSLYHYGKQKRVSLSLVFLKEFKKKTTFDCLNVHPYIWIKIINWLGMTTKYFSIKAHQN